MSFYGYIYISKWREGRTQVSAMACNHPSILLAHSHSQFWPMLHSDNPQMWFREMGSAGKHCGWDHWDDGAFSHMKNRPRHVTCPLGQKASPEPQPLNKYIHSLWDPLCYYQNWWELSHWLLQEHDRRIICCLTQVDIWLQNVFSFLVIPLQFSTVPIIVQIFLLLLMEHTGFLQERPWLKEFKCMTHFKFAGNFKWSTRVYWTTLRSVWAQGHCWIAAPHPDGG